MNRDTFYGGISGLHTPIPKRDFPPAFADKSRLTYYSSIFNSIEINSSFYKIPISKTLFRWATDTPNYFRFTFKLWQGITHNKDLAFNSADVIQFIDQINVVGLKKGCLLVQFPPRLTIAAIPQLSVLLKTIKSADHHNEWRIAVEFRHRSWYEDTVYKLLDTHQACLVIHDLPASSTPLITLNCDHVYVRFHGPNGGYRGSYSEDFLSEYASYVREWQDEEKTVYVYFNNTAGDALANLRYFISCIKT